MHIVQIYKMREKDSNHMINFKKNLILLNWD